MTATSLQGMDEIVTALLSLDSLEATLLDNQVFEAKSEEMENFSPLILTNETTATWSMGTADPAPETLSPNTTDLEDLQKRRVAEKKSEAMGSTWGISNEMTTIRPVEMDAAQNASLRSAMSDTEDLVQREIIATL